MTRLPHRSPRWLRGLVTRAIGAALGCAIPAMALAKPCDLDLQVVLWNAQEAFQAHPIGGAAHALTAGYFGEIEESFVYDLAMSRTRARMQELGVSGRVRQLHAAYSGRPYGWYAWDPASPAGPAATTWGSDMLGNKWMIAIHLDDPRDAAIRVQKTSPTLLTLGKLLGADVRGRVYGGVFDAMVPSLLEYKVSALFNTGFGVRCADVKQTYDDTTAF
ncbi:MAG: hypothetical protein ACOZNI_30470 [Myxococcota bacterium]